MDKNEIIQQLQEENNRYDSIVEPVKELYISEKL